MTPSLNTAVREQIDPELDLKMLQPGDIVAINHAIEEIGPFGEVHLVVQDNRIRYIRIVRSEPVIRASKPRSKGK